MRFYKILKAKQCGNAEGLTAYERQFVEYLKKIDIKTITGVLPLTFTAKGGTAVDWTISGNADGVGEQRVDGYYVPIKVTKHKSYPIQWELKGKAVRDQVTSTKGNEILTWDVIGIDHDECYYADGRRAAHSVTLQLHDCFASLQFEEREALFYAESTMPAGTYHFTVREQPWYASDVGKTFQFTLTQTLAAGSQICITNAYNAAMTSGKIKTFSDGSSTTAIETVDITEGSDGTDLGDVRNALVGQNTNSIQRALLGSNNWANSAMRQWLNSSAAAGSVWTPKTKFDRPPSWVYSIAGFLNGMDEDFVKAVGTVKKTTALNAVTDGGGKVESDERFFLLSRSEVYGGNEVAGGEGAAYSYYADYSDLSGAGIGADTNRIKYRNNAAQFWWLRSPNVPTAGNVRSVITTGIVTSNIATNSFGVAPAICIPMDEVYDCNEVDIYIGDSPLTEGETVSKTSTGVDIELFEGENTVSTTLYNKPTMEIKYK